jgi:hypothetical protein
MTKKAATCIAIDEARAETPFSATLGTEANDAARMKLTATPESLVVEIGLVGLKRPLGRQGAEFLMAVTLRHLRAYWPRHPPDPGGVRARPQCRPAGIRDFFGCPAELGRAQSVAAAAAFPVQCFLGRPVENLLGVAYAEIKIGQTTPPRRAPPPWDGRPHPSRLPQDDR